MVQGSSFKSGTWSHTHLSPIPIASSPPPSFNPIRIDGPLFDFGLLVGEHEPAPELRVAVSLGRVSYTSLSVEFFLIPTCHPYESADVFGKTSSDGGFPVVSVDGCDDLGDGGTESQPKQDQLRDAMTK